MNKKAFGREALFMLGAMFQHTSKICEEGQFLDPTSLIQLVTENGKYTTFCKKPGSSQHRVFSLEVSVVHDVFSP